jgi:uncharacterized protein YuzE
MKYDYDSEADVLVIRLSEKKPDFGEQEGNVITHYTEDNKPVQIEILDASETAIGMIQAMLPKRDSLEA